METALFNNRTVTVLSFLRARKSPQDRATCPGCGEKLYLSAARSTRKTASFNHMPGSEDKVPCGLSYQDHPSYLGLKDVDLDEVQHRADVLKSDFYEFENLKRAFTFLTKVAGKGAVNRDVFVLLLQKADKFKIWQFAGLPVWAVPYILLTLTDFYIRREPQPSYVVRFIIDKPSRSKLNATWLQPEQCALVKYFVNEGKATKMFGAQQSAAGKSSGAGNPGRVKNPLPFSEAEFNQLTADTSWISNVLDNLLAEIAVEAVIEVDETPECSVPTSNGAAPANAANHVSRPDTGSSNLVSTESPMLSSRPTLPAATALARASANEAGKPALGTPLSDSRGLINTAVDGLDPARALPGDEFLDVSTPVEGGEVGRYQPPHETGKTSARGSPIQQFVPASAVPAKLDIRVGNIPPSHTASGPTTISHVSAGVKDEAVPSRSAPESTNVKILPPILVKPSVRDANQTSAKGLWGWLKSLFC